MTVAVFSGIIIFVNSIQGPGDRTFVDLVPTLERTGPNSGIITITHAGGQPLDAAATGVFVQVNASRYVLAVTDGLTPDNGRWVTGQRWAFSVPSPNLPTGATVQVSVVDRNTNQLVLLAVVQRGVGTGGVFPIIGTGTVTPDGYAVNDGSTLFGLRVIAVDYDYDLPDNGVRVDLGPLGCGFTTQTLMHVGFGVYESPTLSNMSSCVTAKTYTVNITATDSENHTSFGSMLFEVRKSPFTGPTSTGTGPFGWVFANEFQAYEIFNETEWETNRYLGNGTRTFVKGENVVIVVASQYIKNLGQRNELDLYGTSPLPIRPVVYGAAPYTDPVSATSTPSSLDAFEFEEFIAGFFVYTTTFTTDSSLVGFDGVQMSYGVYSVKMELRADNVPPPRNRFATSDEITVTDAFGNLPDFPRLRFFSDSSLTNETETFHWTDTVYATVTVNDTDTSVVFGDIQIMDYVGGIQVWARPGTAPVGSASVADSTTYRFSVDLSAPNLDPWVFSTNAYAFHVREVTDSNEEYALVEQIVIEGPEWGLDVIVGIEEYSHPVHDGKTYAAFYANDLLWSRNVIEFYESLPSANSPAWGGGIFNDVTYADFDGDGDLDAAYALEASRVWVYRNSFGSGLKWERYEIDYLGGVEVLSIASGPLDRDADPEIVAGTAGGEVWEYTNDGKYTPSLIADLNTPINAIRVADVTGDGFNDVVLGTGDGHVKIYINDGFGVFGTTVVTDYVMASDIAVQGIVSGTYAATQTSNNVYETITEVNGSGETVEVYEPLDEFVPAYGIIESGSYANTLANDGSPYEVLAEEFYNGPGPNDKWMIRNSSAGAQPGHMYAFGSISSLGASDSAALTIDAFLADGTEPIEIRYKVGSGSPSSVLAYVNQTSEATITVPLTGFSGGELYIILQDSDTSDNDGSSDAKQTKVAIDYLSVSVTRASGVTSRLEHKWRSDTIGSGGSAYRVFIEAFRTTSVDNDTYVLEWSKSSSGPWSYLTQITATSDTDRFQTAILPNTVGGSSIYFRVVDSNHSANATTPDSLRVDHLFVRRYVVVPNVDTIGVGAAVADLDVGDVDGDGTNDIVVAAGSNAIVYIGTNFSSSRTLAAGFTVATVDLGRIDSDDSLDIVAGGGTDVVYWISGTWTKVSIADLTDGSRGNVLSMAVADVDSDLWDDVVIGTDTGQIIWFRHVKGSTWSSQQIDNIESAVYCLALGDVDRGIVLDYAN